MLLNDEGYNNPYWKGLWKPTKLVPGTLRQTKLSKIDRIYAIFKDFQREKFDNLVPAIHYPVTKSFLSCSLHLLPLKEPTLCKKI
jgi:hypothetical protein